MTEKASGQLSGEEAEEEQKGSMTMGQGSSIRKGRRTLPAGNGPVLSALEGVRGLCLVIRSVERILWRVKSQVGMDRAKSPLSSGTGRQAGNGWERGGMVRGVGISFYGNGSLC